MKMTEEDIAIKLLKGKIKDYELEFDEDRSLTELLAFISMFNEGITWDIINEFHIFLINNNYELNSFLRKLDSLKCININEDSPYRITHLGQSIAKSFLTLDQSLEILNILKLKSKTIIEIALELNPLKNVYLSKNVVAELSRNVNMKYFSNNLFSASVLSLMNAEYVKKKRGNYSNEFINFISKWITDIFNCKCKDNPYCDCGKLNLEKMILALRTEEGLSIDEISDYLKDEYKILVFKGDLIDYLENLIHSLESIKNISEGIQNIGHEYKNELLRISHLIDQIKNIKKDYNNN